MSDLTARISDNLAAVRDQIASAARRSGRTADDITLVAVTKYVDPAAANALLQLGCRDLGESRPQDLWSKSQAITNREVRWHLIGHLQRNKVRRTLPLVSLIHSADSLRLLEELDRESAALQQVTSVLLEVNISGDATKHGFHPTEMANAVAAASQLSHLKICGLMGMASREGDLDSARNDFRHLRELRDQLKSSTSQCTLQDLSMGMSGDFVVAIEEGATIVRVGSRLFEGLNP